MKLTTKKNFLKKFLNGVDLKKWNNYIEEQGMELLVKIFIINVIIKAQLFFYIKMIKDIYLADMLRFLGLVIMENGIKMMKVLFLL